MRFLMLLLWSWNNTPTATGRCVAKWHSPFGAGSRAGVALPCRGGEVWFGGVVTLWIVPAGVLGYSLGLGRNDRRIIQPLDGTAAVNRLRPAVAPLPSRQSTALCLQRPRPSSPSLLPPLSSTTAGPAVMVTLRGRKPRKAEGRATAVADERLTFWLASRQATIAGVGFWRPQPRRRESDGGPVLCGGLGLLSHWWQCLVRCSPFFCCEMLGLFRYLSRKQFRNSVVKALCSLMNVSVRQTNLTLWKSDKSLPQWNIEIGRACLWWWNTIASREVSFFSFWACGEKCSCCDYRFCWGAV